MAGFCVLSEFDPLTLSDYLYFCAHNFLAYQWLVLALACSLLKNWEGFFVRVALLSEIGQTRLIGVIRYRRGRQLAPLVLSNDCFVQWF